MRRTARSRRYMVERNERLDDAWTVTTDNAGKRWGLDDSGQWYDFEVVCDVGPTWSRRFAGRVETGRHSVSDPAMGTAGY